MKNEQGFTIIKNSQKLCDFLKNDKMAWPGIKRHSNLPDACPIPKVSKKITKTFQASQFLLKNFQGKYSIKDYEYDANDLPPFIPPGVYYTKTYAAENNNIKYGWQTDFDVKH
jgi:hypothetical protein